MLKRDRAAAADKKSQKEEEEEEPAAAGTFWAQISSFGTAFNFALDANGAGFLSDLVKLIFNGLMLLV